MVESLVQVAREVRERTKAASLVALFLDFDGTLVPIEADPTAPRLDPAAKEILQTISEQESLVTTIISGRAIEDLYARVRLQHIIYAGNHGLEIFGRNLRFVDPVADSLRGWLERICEDLQASLAPIPGALVEYKGLSASIHYRQAAEADIAEIERLTRAGAAVAGDLFRVNRGRKILEIVPRTGWNKGTAARWILDQLGEPPILPVYVGDDTTDEDAFAALPEGVTIKVGEPGETRARYVLPDPTAVHEFLLWLTIQEPAVSWKG